MAFSSGVADARRAPARAGSLALEPATAAWLAAVPVALVTAVAAVLLGPALGSALLPAPSDHLLPGAAQFALPEPTEQARYLIALAAPVLLAAGALALLRRAPRVPAGAAALAAAVELAAVLFVAGCFVAQRLQSPQTNEYHPPIVYFTLASLAVAALVAGALAAGARSTHVRALARAWTTESRPRRVAAALAAVAATALVLLPALETDGSIANAFEAVQYHLQFTYDESMAVLAGRSPLGNFAAQYSALWPYVLAGGMTVVGSSLAAFTSLVAVLAGGALLALYDLLRRVARSSLGGLLLYLPLLATCQFRLEGGSVARFSLVNYFGVLPLRYAGPFLLAWLTARHLDGARPRRTWPLFLAGGLVVLNNPDFGLPALGATVAALAWTRDRTGAPSLRRGLAEAALGLANALAVVTVLLLVRTGAPPHLGLLFLYAHIYVADGFAMLPIQPLLGFDLVVFLTYVAAIGAATVRALGRAPDRLLTGLLAWSGIFGLGAGSYYVGHSLSEVLTYTFPAWALSVTLLAVVVLRRLAGVVRLPTAGELACLFGLGLLVCSLAQTPLPWRQVERMREHVPSAFAQPLGQPFVAQHTRRGEPVTIMTTLGHRMAFNLHLKDVEAFTGAFSVFTTEQLDRSLAALRAAGGSKVFISATDHYGGLEDALRARGFAPRAQEPRVAIQLWTR